MHIQMENMAKEQNGCKFANSVQTAVMQDQLTVLDAQIRKDRNQHFSELAALFATTRVLRFDLNATNLANENLVNQVANLSAALSAQSGENAALRGKNAAFQVVLTRWFRIIRDVHMELGSVWVEEQ